MSMDAIAVPKLTVSFAVDLEIEYDSFGGKTPEQMAEAIQDELDDLLFEVSPGVVAVFTTLTAVDSND